MIRVSIIMPVYNSEKYLRKAIDSVMKQSFPDFELILVDDGSEDGSGVICDEYGERYPNVKVIHKKNEGICSARNIGINCAQGEYIGFCDNDDEYLPNLIEDNYKLAKENNVDLMRYAKIKRIEKADGRTWESVSDIKDMFIEREKFSRFYYNIRKEDTVWTGLYRRSIIENSHIRFDETFRYGHEDFNFNLCFLKHCEKLGFNSKAYYSWTQREAHSTSRKFHREYLEKICSNLQLEYEFMVETCGNTVDNVEKNIFLTNAYVHSILDYFSIQTCDMSLSEKAEYLNKIRNHPIFDKRISLNTLKEVRKRNLRVYITMKLFYEKKYKLLIVLLNKGTAFLDLFRFKKVQN